MTSESNSKNTNAKKTTKKTVKKTAVTFFTANAVERTRTSKSGDGGRYNPTTRRLTVPTKFGGRAVAVAVANGIIVVGGEGGYKCHPTQHFVTLPAGTIDSAKKVTLEKVDLPSAVASLGDNAVAYKLPKPTKKSSKKSTKKSTEPTTKAEEPSEESK